jgi:pSer/pThr/pTyr-binding forkhead associated (FHA) protein
MVLQYSLLVLIYIFLFKVIKIVYADISAESSTAVRCNHTNAAIPMQAKLLVVDSGHVKLAQTSFPLDETVYIGRSENNGIVIDDFFVSHEHASINRYQHEYWLTDLNSTNKTYLNGQPITETILLKNSDLIKVGAVTFSFKG